MPARWLLREGLMMKHTAFVLGGAGGLLLWCCGMVSGQVFLREGEGVSLALPVPKAVEERISSVEYWGQYTGYDENGDGIAEGPHGFTKDGRPVGNIGVADKPPFAVTWDLSMLPDQDTWLLAVDEKVRFKGPALVVRTRGKPVPRAGGSQ